MNSPFTARTFLKSPIYKNVPQLLKSDPERIAKEFLTFAVNPKEPFFFRTKSLRVLNIHAHDLEIVGSLYFSKVLISAFDAEFPPERLNELALASHGCQACYLIYLFCTTLAQIAPDAAKSRIDLTLRTFAGTTFESDLASHLETIKRQKRA